MKKPNGMMVVGAALAIAMVGCRRAPESHVANVPKAQLEQGWEYTESRDHTVAIAVPSGWRAGVDTLGSSLDMASHLGGSSADSQSAPDPGFNAEMQQMAKKFDADNKKQEDAALAKLEEKGIIVNVINGSKPTPGEQRTRFYVKRDQSNGGMSLLDAASKERKHFAFSPKPSDVKLPIGPAIRLSADDSLNDGMTLHQISYVIIDGTDTYTLRFVTEEAAESIQSVADQVAQSLRISPKH